MRRVVCVLALTAFIGQAAAQAVSETYQQDDKNLHGDISETSTGQNSSFTLLGKQVLSGDSKRLSWKPQDTFDSIAAPSPVIVVHGSNPGPTLCLTGAVHGDEINGIEIIRQIMFSQNAQKLSGTLIGVPIVNQMGFRRSSRYLSDRRDLNRHFPGNPRGSSASRIAHSFFHDVVTHCEVLVDIHTGSFHRTNIPQLRADMRDQKVADLVHSFGGMVVLHNPGARGSLRRAAVEAGIPAVTMEIGEPMRIQSKVISDGVKRIRAMMSQLGMTKRPYLRTGEEPIYFNSRWVRADEGGLLISQVKLGDRVISGQVLGAVVDPITNKSYHIESPADGQIIGMALNQVVMPGYAAYHLGVETTEAALEASESEDGSEAVMDAVTDPMAPEDEG